MAEAEIVAETELSRWLKENGAVEDEIKAFAEEDFQSISEITADDIDKYVKKTGTKRRLKEKLRQQTAPAEKRDPLPPPDLPAGATFDLSAPVLSHEKVEFSVPTALSVDMGDRPIHPGELANHQWMVIAKNASVLFGFDMGDDTPKRAMDPVYLWKVPRGSSFFQDAEDEGGASSEVTYTSEAASYVAEGMDRESATASYAFCSASFERSSEHKEAQSSSHSRRYTIGMWRYPRARLFLERCAAVSPEFPAAVREALASKTPRAALQTVFARFGHAVPREVLLGGQLTMIDVDDESASASEEQSKSRMTAAMSVKIGGASASASVDVENASKSQKELQEIAQRTSFVAKGGDTMLASVPAKWTPTVNHPNEWAVIEKAGVRPIIELLDEELQEQILQVWSDSGPGDPVPAKIGVPETVERGGFVSGMVFAGPNPGEGRCVLYTDPDLVRKSGGASVSFHTGYNCLVGSGSFFIPIARGDRYHAYWTVVLGEARITAAWQPFDLGFGIWESLQAGVSYTGRAEDGFVLGYIGTNQNSRQAYATYSAMQGRNGDLQTCMVTSVARSPTITMANQSFCTPVPRGNDFKVVAREMTNCDEVGIYWVPVTGPYRFGQAQTVAANGAAVRASQDGILFGYVSAQRVGDRGAGALRVDYDRAKVDADAVQSAIGTVQWSDDDRRMPSNALTALVRKDQYYRAHLRNDGSSGLFGQFRFMPIVPT